MQTADCACVPAGRSMRSLHVYEQLTNHACNLRIDLPAGMKNAGISLLQQCTATA